MDYIHNFPFDDFYSHPPEEGHDGIPLEEHLIEVSNNLESEIPNIEVTTEGKEINELARIVGLCHDFGKFDPAVQCYLDGNNISTDTSHSLVSAYVGLSLAKSVGFNDIDSLSVFIVIAKHHSSLPNVASYIQKKYGDKQKETTLKKIERIYNAADQLENYSPIEVLQKIKGDSTLIEIYKFVKNSSHKEIFDFLRSYGQFDPNNIPEKTYEIIKVLYGTLIFSDRIHAMKLEKGKEFSPLPIEKFENHLKEKQKVKETEEFEQNPEQFNIENKPKTKQLDIYRTKAQQKIEETESYESKIYDLTLPTGFGKTYSAFVFAGNRQEKQQNPGPIIYALPFTSIVEQVTDEFKKSFSIDEQKEYLTVHHNLRDVSKKTARSKDKTTEDDLQKFLGQSWRSGAIVTTYVQLWESVVSPQKNQSSKLPNLENSTIILDEPQSLDLSLWPAIRKVSETLVNEYNAAIVSMTATQPSLYTNSESLVNRDDFFGTLSRVEYSFHPSARKFININEENSPLSIEKASKILRKKTGSKLVICNTINTAQKLYEKYNNSDVRSLNKIYDENEIYNINKNIKEKFNENTNNDTEYVSQLTTRHRPIDRKKILKGIEGLLEENKNITFIATQIVEAGVDISFETVYRDFAPIDSIVQAGGRCNREFENDIGTVTVWHLDGDNKLTPAESIYKKGEELSKLGLTKKSLSQTCNLTSKIPENVVTMKTVPKYYEMVDQKISNEDILTQNIENSNFSYLREKFEVIETRNSIDLFVPRTENEYNKIQRLRKKFKENKYNEASSILQELTEIRVSFPIYSIDNPPDIATSTPIVTNEVENIIGRLVDARTKTTFFDAENGINEQANDSKYRVI